MERFISILVDRLNYPSGTTDNNGIVWYVFRYNRPSPHNDIRSDMNIRHNNCFHTNMNIVANYHSTESVDILKIVAKITKNPNTTIMSR